MNPRLPGSCLSRAGCLRVEFLLKTDSGYLNFFPGLFLSIFFSTMFPLVFWLKPWVCFFPGYKTDEEILISSLYKSV